MYLSLHNKKNEVHDIGVNLINITKVLQQI